jgi:hypothetical protein
MEEAMGEGKNAFIANKYLADKGWKKKPAKDKDTAPVGRPKKPAINQFEYDPASINADLKRLEALEQVHTNVQMDELSKRRSALTSTFVEEEIPTSVQ